MPAPARKPGAQRNGAPFREWALPTSLERIRRRLRLVSDGDRRTVEILGAVLGPVESAWLKRRGIVAVAAACAEALAVGSARPT